MCAEPFPSGASKAALAAGPAREHIRNHEENERTETGNLHGGRPFSSIASRGSLSPRAGLRDTARSNHLDCRRADAQFSVFNPAFE